MGLHSQGPAEIARSGHGNGVLHAGGSHNSCAIAIHVSVGECVAKPSHCAASMFRIWKVGMMLRIHLTWKATEI